MPSGKFGIWIVGARGGVATTAALGLLALRRGLTSTCGLVSDLPQFASLPLADWDAFVIGGHEIRDSCLRDEAVKLSRVSRAVDLELIEMLDEDLAAVDANIRPGTACNVGPVISTLASTDVRDLNESPQQAVEHIQKDIGEFAGKHELDEVVVVNLASTEPPAATDTLPGRWEQLQPQLAQGGELPLGASSLYAIAAMEAGRPYVNFTPSQGACTPAIEELAQIKKTCHAGRDGKTGETLLKSVLAPMFAARNLQVMSWVGQNIFGNMDAVVLRDPENKKAKATSKDHLLHEILGYRPQTLVGIDFVESLGDWKTAWDHIHFKGFLNTPMIMQFTWQGCDSILAAPLVLDLVRLTLLAKQRGEVGALGFLSSFFKSPVGTSEQVFAKQFQMLEGWAAAVGG